MSQFDLNHLLDPSLSPADRERAIFQFMLASLPTDTAEALRRVALPHWFDEAILEILTPPLTPLQHRGGESETPLSDVGEGLGVRLDSLTHLSFVKPRQAGGYLLHDKSRADLLAEWQTHRRDEAIALHRRLADYFATLSDDFNAQAEALYHALAAEPTTAWVKWQTWFKELRNKWQLSQAEQLLTLAEEQAWALDEPTRAWLPYHRAELLAQSSNYRDAAELLRLLVAGNDRVGVQNFEPQRARAASLLGHCLKTLGQWPEAELQLQTALTLQRADNDHEGLLMTLARLADFYTVKPDYPQAIAYAQEQFSLSEPYEDQTTMAGALFGLGQIYDFQQQLDKATEHYQRSLTMYQAWSDEAGLAKCWSKLGGVYQQQRDYDTALKYLRQALATREKLADLRGQSITLNEMGNVYLAQRKHTRALEMYEQSLAIDTQVGDLRGQGITLHAMGNVYRAQGEYARALEIYEQALALKQQVGDLRGQGITLHAMGNVYHAQGEHARALEIYEQALTLYQQVGELRGQGVTLHEIGNVYQAQGEHARALEMYEQALALKQQAGDLRGQSVTLWEMARAYEAQGNYAAALWGYEQSLAIDEQIDRKEMQAMKRGDIARVRGKIKPKGVWNWIRGWFTGK